MASNLDEVNLPWLRMKLATVKAVAAAFAACPRTI
jgi:hypothetical protein